MNDLTRTSPHNVAGRNIDDVTREVIELKQQATMMMVCYIIEIGRRLREAKEMLPHGEWGNWLKDKVQYSQSTADNYMKIFDEYGADQISFFGLAKSQTLGNLPYTKALKLLALPSDERESFVEENNVAELSVRDLDRLIEEKKKAEAERDAEKARAEALEKEKAELESAREESAELETKIAELSEKLDKATEAKKKSDAKLKELKENPSIPDEVLDRIKSEVERDSKAFAEQKLSEAQAKAEKEDAIKEIKEQLEKAQLDKKEADLRAKLSEERLAEAEKKARMSSPEAAIFKVRFEEAQKALSAVDKALIDVEQVDQELASKFKKAMSALVTRYKE
jgi:myosin heavy subunit